MKEFKVDEKNKGQKLFRYLKNILPGLKNNDIFKLIRKKVVSVNGKKVTPEYILENNDAIKIFLNETHFEDKGKNRKFSAVNKRLPIVFEDQNILVVDKPKGLLTHPDKKEFKNCLYEMARSYLYEKKEYDPKDVFAPTPCHRLDKNTSGLVVIAKNHASLQDITGKLRERKTEKNYKALVLGKVDKSFLITSVIDSEGEKVLVKNLSIIYNDLPENKITFLNKNLEISATLVSPEITGDNCSLVSIDLWTGKKHQIRAHLTAAGYPLLGDKKYFNRASQILSKKMDIQSYFLHAYRVKTENYPEFISDLPDNFKNVIKKYLKAKNEL